MKVIGYLFAAIVFIRAKAQDTTNATDSSEVTAQQAAFLAYTAEFGKSYASTGVFDQRFDNWQRTDSYIQAHNTSELMLEHNKFSDWTLEEKDQILNKELASQLPFSYDNLPRLLDPQPTKTCPTGYRLQVSKCIKCPAGCKTCTSDTACSSCMSDKFAFTARSCDCFSGGFNATLNDCNVCGENLFWNSTQQCDSCNVTNCVSCQLQNQCFQCRPNFTLDAASGQCICEGYQNDTLCIKCDSDQFVRDNLCHTCAENCTTCDSPSGDCLTCVNPTYAVQQGQCMCPHTDHFMNETNNECVEYVYCGLGSYNDGDNSCFPCGEYCQSCNSVTGLCNQCQDPSFELIREPVTTNTQNLDPRFFNLTQPGECRCPPNHYLANGKCVRFSSCPDGHYSTYTVDGGLQECRPCAGNCSTCDHFTGICIECQDISFNQTLLSLEAVCECPETQKLQADGTCAPKYDCPTGYYNDDHNVCLECTGNCSQCEDVTGRCTECLSSYSLQVGSDVATLDQCQCNYTYQHYVAANNTCVDLVSCPSGERNVGKNVCLKCNDDFCDQCDLEGVCTQCLPSFTYRAQNDSCHCPYPDQWFDASINQCRNLSDCGRANFNDGEDNCLPCPVNCGDCVNWNGTCPLCDSTFVFYNDTCDCPWNQFKSWTGLCDPCGSHCSQCDDYTGNCTECTNPSYTRTLGNNATCECKPDEFVSTKTGNCTLTEECPTETYNDSQNNCLACEERVWRCTGPGASAFECKDSYRLTNGTCHCKEDGTQFEKDGRCHDIIDCGAFHWNNGENNCLKCKDNCTWCTDNDTCTECNQSYLLDYPQQGECACGPGMFQNQNDGFCYGCQGGYGCDTCRDGDGYCTKCKEGWTYNRGQCFCWAPGFQSGSECKSCPVGCWSCGNNQECWVCKPTFTKDYPQAQQCNCLADQFINSQNECQTCDQYALTCEDYTGLATSCMSTFDLVEGYCVCGESKFIPTTPQETPACINQTQCRIGYYNRGDNTCLKCPLNDNCLNCDLQDGVPKCIRCAQTFTLDATAGTYGTCQCQDQQYLSKANTCLNCSTNAVTCADTTGSATECLPSFSIIGGKCRCQANQYLNSTNSTCQNCPDNCASCSDSTTCTSCVASFTFSAESCGCAASTYLSETNNTCVKVYKALNGFYNDGTNNMVACQANCAKCSADEPCQSCEQTFTYKDGQCDCLYETQFLNTQTQRCEDIKTCPLGQFNDGSNVCSSCAVNCTSCEGSATNCTSCKSGNQLDYPQAGQCACPAGTYQNSRGICVAVGQNCSRAEDKTGLCTNCLESFFYNDIKYECACLDNQNYNPIEPSCGECPVLCSQCSNATFCTGCRPGYDFDPQQGTCVCNGTDLVFKGEGCVTYEGCQDGQYNSGLNQCFKCDPGCDTCDDHTGRCNQCLESYTLLGGACSKWRRLSRNLQEQQETSLGDNSKTKNCIPVGPVDFSTKCLEEAYSDERVVPEFNEDAVLVDWRVWDVVRPVQDQGSCSGGFAFSTTAQAESTYAIKTGLLYDLSEQFLLDCDQQSKGCNGGWQTSAGFLLSTNGAVLEADYPYVGVTQTCVQRAISNQVFQLEYPGSLQVSSSKEAFKSSLRKAPLNVSFKVTSDLFYQYKGGIIPADTCTSEDALNHSMLAIGYGVDDKQVEYAIVQNQWGANWGDQGVFRLELTVDSVEAPSEGPCGLYMQTLQPVL